MLGRFLSALGAPVYRAVAPMLYGKRIAIVGTQHVGKNALADRIKNGEWPAQGHLCSTAQGEDFVHGARFGVMLEIGGRAKAAPIRFLANLSGHESSEAVVAAKVIGHQPHILIVVVDPAQVVVKDPAEAGLDDRSGVVSVLPSDRADARLASFSDELEKLLTGSDKRVAAFKKDLHVMYLLESKADLPRQPYAATFARLYARLSQILGAGAHKGLRIRKHLSTTLDPRAAFSPVQDSRLPEARDREDVVRLLHSSLLTPVS